jgi:hypothetical protein
MKDVSFPFFHSRDRSVAATFIIDRNSREKNSYVDLVDCSSLGVLYQANFFFFFVNNVSLNIHILPF